MIQLFDIKTRTLGFAFCQPPKKSLPKISYPKKVTTKFQTQKKSSDGKFQTQKRASHFPVTSIPEYPPPPLGCQYSMFFCLFNSRAGSIFFQNPWLFPIKYVYILIKGCHRSFENLAHFGKRKRKMFTCLDQNP